MKSIILALSLLGQGGAEASIAYTVAITADAPRVAVVEIVLPAPVEELQMSDRGANHLDAGWTHFVRELSAIDADGNNVNVEKVGARSWRLKRFS